jgi:mannan endo-1,4-beta-mannosidase
MRIIQYRKALLIILAAVLLTPGLALAKKKKKAAATPTPVAAVSNGISVQGLFLTRDGKPFILTGVEKRGLFHQSSQALKAFFDQVKLSGASVVKTNAFSLTGTALQKGPSQYDEAELAKVDQMVALAKADGLKLVLSLSADQSPDGGKAEYAAWAGSGNPNVFFFDYKCKGYYQDFVKALLTRKNTVTGVAYNQEPAILAWDLMDSPTNKGDEGDQFNRWVSIMSAQVKSLAPGQFVALTLWAQSPGIAAAQCAGDPGIDLILLRAVPGQKVPYPIQVAQQAGKPVAGLSESQYASAWAKGSAGGVVTLPDLLDKTGEADSLKTVLASLSGQPASLPGEMFKDVKAAPEGKPTLIQEASVRISASLNSPAKVSVHYGPKGVLSQETVLTQDAKAEQSIVLEHLRARESYAYQVKAVDGTGKATLSNRMSFTAPELVPVLADSNKRSNNFITVKGTNFYDGDKIFRYVGTNSYELHYAEPKTVEYVLGTAEKLGLTVIRTWAYGETNKKTFPDWEKRRYFVLGPGQYVEENLQDLDRLVADASKHHLRLILCLSNNWTDFGGAPMWVQYFGSHEKNDFFDKPEIKKAFKDYMAMLVNRVNTVTKTAYKDDPTIMAWDLMNEPRYERDPTGRVLAAWAEEMAGFLKTQGIHQLVTTGSEGLRAENGTQYSGSDFISVHQGPSIDFAVYHLYPADDNYLWNWTTTKAVIEAYVRDCHALLKKPVVMEEFGISGNKPKYDKPVWVYDMVQTFYKAGGNGTNYWMISEPGFKGDGNEFTSEQTELCNIFALEANALAEGK